MMDYSKRKNFLPSSYLQRKSLNYKDKDNKALIILTLIIVILVPINLNSYVNITDKAKSEEATVSIEEEKSKIISINSIYNWVELYENTKSPISITNGNGDIVISEIKKIDSISEKVDVLNISRNSDKYRVTISKGDEYEK